jgi:hypothetical protein
MHQVLSCGCFTFGCPGAWPCTNKRIPAHKGMISSCLDNHQEGNHEQFPWLSYDGRVLYRRRGHSSLINEKMPFHLKMSEIRLPDKYVHPVCWVMRNTCDKRREPANHSQCPTPKTGPRVQSIAKAGPRTVWPVAPTGRTSQAWSGLGFSTSLIR